MWILEPLKNQSESWKSSGNLFLKKGTNPVSLSWTWGPEKSKGFCCYYVPSKTWLALHCTSGENWEADKGDMYKEQKLRIAKKNCNKLMHYLHLLQSNSPIWGWTNILSLAYVARSSVLWKVLLRRKYIHAISKFVMYSYRKPNRQFCGPGSLQNASKHTLNVQTAINLYC